MGIEELVLLDSIARRCFYLSSSDIFVFIFVSDPEIKSNLSHSLNSFVKVCKEINVCGLPQSQGWSHRKDGKSHY